MHHQTSGKVKYGNDLIKHISIEFKKVNPHFFDGLNPCRLRLSNSGGGGAHPKERKL